MKAKLSDFKTGWQGLSQELSTREIDQLILALGSIRNGSGHFHFRSSFRGEAGIGDIEISCSGQSQCHDLELELEQTPEVSPDGQDT